jgi:hypothetical protein
MNLRFLHGVATFWDVFQTADCFSFPCLRPLRWWQCVPPDRRRTSIGLSTWWDSVYRTTRRHKIDEISVWSLYLTVYQLYGNRLPDDPQTLCEHLTWTWHLALNAPHARFVYTDHSAKRFMKDPYFTTLTKFPSKPVIWIRRGLHADKPLCFFFIVFMHSFNGKDEGNIKENLVSVSPPIGYIMNAVGRI